MVCTNNPCSKYLPKVGDASPIVGDSTDLQNVATHFSGGGRKRRTRRHHRKSHRKSHRAQRKMKKGGTLRGGKSRRARRAHRRSEKGGW